MLLLANAFIRSHLDYADAFYGQAHPQKKLGLKQRNAALALTEGNLMIL